MRTSLVRVILVSCTLVATTTSSGGRRRKWGQEREREREGYYTVMEEEVRQEGQCYSDTGSE